MVTLEVITVLLMLGPQQKRHTREQALETSFIDFFFFFLVLLFDH